MNGGNPNHSALLGSQTGVRGLPDSLYRNRSQAYANLEIRHAVEIAAPQLQEHRALGLYDDEAAAARACDRKRRELRGEGPYDFPDELPTAEVRARRARR